MKNLKTMYGTTDQIIETVSLSYGVNSIDVKGNRRFDELMTPRQVIMYFLKFYCKLKLRIIADILGKKDHTSIIHGIKQVENRKQYDKVYEFYYNQAIKEVESNFEHELY